jgi:homospermidine synthase
MKNRVLCEDCIKDKSTYSDWTPLDNIEDLISNILETDKLMKSNALR